MAKWVGILFVALSFISSDAHAGVSASNVDIGVFRFSTYAEAPGQLLNGTTINVFLTDRDGLNPAPILSDVWVETRDGRTIWQDEFVALPGDDGLSRAVEYLTNGREDTIKVSQVTRLRIDIAEGTEPDLLFGDPTGRNGIDFSGRSIEFIVLKITRLFLVWGQDPGAIYTRAWVDGVVTVNGAPAAPSFADVPADHWAGRSIEALVNAGVTAGCSTSPSLYCPESPVTREQMAIFMLRGMGITPPACTTAPFPDVPCGSPFAASVAELVRRGITAGCGGELYCPRAPVTRDQMAIFLLRAIGVTPPACTSPSFPDVPCASLFADWVEELVARGITAGCGGGLYCPGNLVTRAQMAVFLVRAFNLPF